MTLAQDAATRAGRGWVGLWDLVMAVYDSDPRASAVLRSAGFDESRVRDEALGREITGVRGSIAPEVINHLSWTAGFLAGRGRGQEDHGTAFILSCVAGPTSSLQRWLQRAGADPRELSEKACEVLQVPSTAIHVRTWQAIQPHNGEGDAV
jgi:hypothetical protein